MRLHGIRGVCLRQTTWQSRTVSPNVVAASVLQRDFIAAEPNQKWAGDITSVSTREGWLYLTMLVDLYSRRIVGWAMADRVITDLTMTALTMALQQRGARVTCFITRIAAANTRPALSATAHRPWHPVFEESARELLGQRGGRELLCQFENRTDLSAAVSHAAGSAECQLQVCGRVL